MSGLTDFRAQHPEYNAVPDGVLADKLYQKFYSSIPREQFDAKLGLKAGGADDNPLHSKTASNIASEAMGVADPILGANEMLQHGFYGAGQLLTSAGGLYPNKVSDWMGEAAKGGDKIYGMANDALAKERESAGLSGFDPHRLMGNIALPAAGVISKAATLGEAIASGVGFGASQPLNEGESQIKRTENAGMGGIGGAAGYGINKAVDSVAGAYAGAMGRKASPAPTTAQLKGGADYASFAQKPITLTPEAVSVLGDDAGQTAIRQALDEARINRESHLVSEFQDLLKPGEAFHPNVVSTEAADKIRQAFDSLANDAGTPNAARGWSSRSDAMETAIQQTPEINDARNTWAQFRKSQILDKTMQRAQDAGGTPAGFGDSAQALRREFLNLTRSQKFASFNSDEQDAIKAVANGTLGTNTLQRLGKFSPVRGHLTSLLELGGAVGGDALGYGAAGALPAIGLATAGEAARQGSNYATGRAARMASELVRRGGQAAPAQLSPRVRTLVQALQQGGQAVRALPAPVLNQLLDASGGPPLGR